MEVSWEYVLALVTAVGSVLSSSIAIKRLIQHENHMCDERMEAFKEGLKYGEDHT